MPNKRKRKMPNILGAGERHKSPQGSPCKGFKRTKASSETTPADGFSSTACKSCRMHDNPKLHPNLTGLPGFSRNLEIAGPVTQPGISSLSEDQANEEDTGQDELDEAQQRAFDPNRTHTSYVAINRFLCLLNEYRLTRKDSQLQDLN